MIPHESTLALAKAIGGPTVLWMPSGHYSSVMFLPNLEQRIAVGAELLDAVVPRVRHPHVALRVERQADLLVELAGRVARAAKHALEAAVESEDLHALVAGVGHEHLAGSVDGDGPRTPEHTRVAGGAAFGVTEATPLAEELPRRVEVLDTVIPGVGDVDVAVRRDRDTPRLLELTVALSWPAPARGDAAVRIEDRHAGRLAFDHVDLAVWTARDILRIDQHRPTVGGPPVHERAVRLGLQRGLTGGALCNGLLSRRHWRQG